MKTLGMRKVKTSIAVIICLCIFRSFNIEHSFYATIAAVVAMQSSVIKSYKAGRNRMLGTTVGGLTGLLCSLIAPGNIVVCGIGIIVVIYICDLLDWNKSIPIACIVFLATTTNLSPETTPLAYSIYRFLDTFLGVAVSILVNYFVVPPNFATKIISYFKNTFNDALVICKKEFFHKESIKTKKLQDEIISLKDLISSYENEFRLKNKNSVKIPQIKILVTKLDNILVHLNILKSMNGSFQLNYENFNTLKSLFENEDNIPEFKYIESDLNIVYNYHANIILCTMLSLKNEINVILN